MASTIISKLENRSKSNHKLKTTVTTNSILNMDDDGKPLKEINKQISKKSNSQSLSVLKKQNYKEEPNEDNIARSEYLDFTPNNYRGSNPPQMTSIQSEISPLNSVNKQLRVDVYGTTITKKSNKHKVSFIDKVGKGQLETVVTIKRANYEESSNNLGMISYGGQSRAVNLDIEAKDNSKSENCTCICKIF